MTHQPTVALQVHEITPQLRTHPDQPVIVGQDGTRVVLILDPTHAGILAKVIARFDAEHPPAAADLDFELDRTTWLHAMVDLLACQAAASHRPVPVPVPMQGVAR